MWWCLFLASLQSSIHVVYSSDKFDLQGVQASMNSVVHHTRRFVTFYLFGNDHIDMTFDTKQANIIFVNNTLINYEKFTINPGRRRHKLSRSTHIFSRFVFPQMFPKVKIFVYLDADTIVLCDLSIIFDLMKKSPYAVSAVAETSFLSITNLKYTKTMYMYHNFTYSFNNGVYVADTEKWNVQNITEKVIYFLQLNRQHSFFVGHQPAMNLAVGYNYQHLNPMWNFNQFNLPLPDQTCILHWTGSGKPWLNKKRNRIQYIWNSFAEENYEKKS